MKNESENTVDQIKRNNSNKEMINKSRNFDDILQQTGEFGLYQVYLFVMTIPFYFYLAFVFNSQQFLTETSDKYWCYVPELEHLNPEQRLTIAIPLSNSSRHGYFQCLKYKTNWSRVLMTNEGPGDHWETEPCVDGWEFNMTEMKYPTISSELGWVCDKDNYQAIAQAGFFCGAIIGGLVMGAIADRYGRLPALVASNIVSCIGGIATSFSTNFPFFIICRFIVGLGYDNVCTMMYILVLEYTAPKYRSLMANISFAVIYCLATSILPWIALACQHWKTFALATSIPLSGAVFAFLLLPESPRWLLSSGKIDTTLQIIKKIARVNGRKICETEIENFKNSMSREETEEKTSLLQLRRRPPVLKILLLQSLLFISSDLAFDGLIRMAGKLGYDFAMSFTLSSVTEFPALLLLIILLDRCGRRRMFIVSMTLAGLCSALGAIVGKGLPSVCCCVVARFFVNMGYGTALQWAAESLPTTVRGSGIAFIHISAYIAVISSPFIVYLETVCEWLPLAMIGAIAVMGAWVALFLPETCGRPLPQTLHDSELLMNHHNWWSLSFKSPEMTKI